MSRPVAPTKCALSKAVQLRHSIFVFWRYAVRISGREPTILKYFVIFFSHFKQLARLCYNCLLLNPFQVIHQPPINLPSLRPTSPCVIQCHKAVFNHHQHNYLSVLYQIELQCYMFRPFNYMNKITSASSFLNGYAEISTLGC